MSKHVEAFKTAQRAHESEKRKVEVESSESDEEFPIPRSNSRIIKKVTINEEGRRGSNSKKRLSTNHT